MWTWLCDFSLLCNKELSSEYWFEWRLIIYIQILATERACSFVIFWMGISEILNGRPTLDPRTKSSCVIFKNSVVKKSLNKVQKIPKKSLKSQKNFQKSSKKSKKVQKSPNKFQKNQKKIKKSQKKSKTSQKQVQKSKKKCKFFFKKVKKWKKN